MSERIARRLDFFFFKAGKEFNELIEAAGD